MPYNPQIRSICDGFYRYLHDQYIFKVQWEREELKWHYHEYRANVGGQARSNADFGFGSVLFQMARYKPVRLRVLNGNTIIFIVNSYNSRPSQRSASMKRPYCPRPHSTRPVKQNDPQRRSQHDRAPAASRNIPRRVQEGRGRRSTSSSGSVNAVNHVASNSHDTITQKAVINKNNFAFPWKGTGSNRQSNSSGKVGNGVASSNRRVSQQKSPPDKTNIRDRVGTSGGQKSIPLRADGRVQKLVSQHEKLALLNTNEEKATENTDKGQEAKKQLDQKKQVTRMSARSVDSAKVEIEIIDTAGQSRDQKGARNSQQRKKQSTKKIIPRKTIPGVRPDRTVGGGMKMQLLLREYPIPSQTVDAYERRIFVNRSSSSGNREICHLLKKDLSFLNYDKKFHLLLHLEELQYLKDIERYTIQSSMSKERKGNRLLFLNVPGLAEKRPSLLRGDRVDATLLDNHGEECDVCYVGYVHVVEQERVGLGFNQRLVDTFAKGMNFQIEFDFNDYPLKLMHRAIDIVTENDSMFRELLFPTSYPKAEIPPKKLSMYKRAIEGNKEQSTAVHNIVYGNTSSIYIIFGPPGTGKTVTMVESILQLLRLEPNFHILVCALSNSACDLLTKRLFNNIDKKKIFRMHAASRSWKDVPGEIKEVSNYADGEFCFPCVNELMKYRVIICTFVSAGRLASAVFPTNHFNRIFIDESGQALEPECLVALAGVIAEGGKVVLAGDPKQLGPIIRSPIAIENGLQTSLLERLMDTCSIYQKQSGTGTHNPQCVTKLVKNYRSHEAIIKISNEQFYDNDLQVCADEALRTSLCRWEELPAMNFPLIFHGVEGQQMREKTSPSFYNPDEIKVVKNYVNSLLNFRRGRRIKPSDIGIITPYRRQVEKIRREIKNPEIDVGSVEEFQGQERLVIIISTVRSNTDYLKFDARHHLGFLQNPKRFNVSLTRAQALLITIGNPRILCMDRHWGALLKYCLVNKAYRGVKFDIKDMQGKDEELNRLFSEISISEDQVEKEEEENDEDQANPHWRQDP